MASLLRVEDLQVSFLTTHGKLRAIRGVSYDIQKGETVGMVGESGCGKTVTSLAILRLLESARTEISGKVCFNDVELLSLSEEKMRMIRGGRIAMIFQEPMTALNPVLTIGAQITEQIIVHEKVGTTEARSMALELLERVGIASPIQRMQQYPHQLSGGMRQRAMIAMALSCRPDLLIADEPTTALDVTIQAQILDLLQKLQADMGMAIQFITHDMGVISEMSDQIIVMYAGIIVEMASAQELFNHPRHPYTVGLLESIPKINVQMEKLNTIDGSVPSLASLPKGCPFQNRCARVMERCRQEEVVLETMGSRHLVACFNPHP